MMVYSNVSAAARILYSVISGISGRTLTYIFFVRGPQINSLRESLV